MPLIGIWFGNPAPGRVVLPRAGFHDYEDFYVLFHIKVFAIMGAATGTGLNTRDGGVFVACRAGGSTKSFCTITKCKLGAADPGQVRRRG